MRLYKEGVYSLLLGVLFIWLVSRLEGLFSFFLVVTVLSYALYPMVRWCEGRFSKFTRSMIILFIYITFIILGAAAAFIVIPPIASQMKELTSKLPEYAQTLKTMLLDFLSKYQAAHPGATWANTIMEQVQSAYSQAASLGLSIVGVFLTSAMEGLIYMLLLPLIVYYVLLEHSSIKKGFLLLFPSGYRPCINEFLNGANKILERFIRGYIVLAAVTGVIVTLLLSPFIPRYALALGAIAALVKPLPFLGPILGSIPILVVGLATVGPVKAFIALGLYVLTQTLDDFTIAPKIMGNALHLHPLTILIGVMIMHKVLGVWGAFIAAPTLAIAKLGIELIVANLDREATSAA